MNTRQISFCYAPDVQQTCIGFVDDFYKTLVREDGSLNYGFIGRNDFSSWERLHYWEAITPYAKVRNDNQFFLHRLKPRFSHKDKLINKSQDFGDPRVALVKTIEEYEHTTLEWECFGYRDVSRDVRADVILWEMKAKNGFGYASSRVELELHGDKDTLPPVLESANTTQFYVYEGLRLVGLNQFAFFQEGDLWKGVFVVLLQGDIPTNEITRTWGEYAREQTIQYWRNLRPFRWEFTIPEPQIQGMLEACARNILQAREIHNGTAVYQVGPTIYRGLWTVDGHFLLQAAHIMGRQEEAFEQGLMALLSKLQPNGSVEIIPQHYKETAITIATIIRQCELINNDQRLIELWPTILRGVDYIRSLRDKAKAMGPEYPGYRLFPPAILDGGIEGPFPDYTTPSWILVGLKEARDAGRRLQLPETESISYLFDEVMEGFIASATRDMKKTNEGISYLPMIMEHQDYNKPQSATWALAQAMYPGEVFPPDHEYVTNLLRLLDSVDDEQGIPKETGWIHEQAVWGYSAMFYAQVWLYANRPDKAIDYLYAFANHAAPSRVWREEQTLTTSRSSEYCGDMPHNWGSAELIRLVRNALVIEKNGNLELFAALPSIWYPTATQDLVIQDTPTRYGWISLRLKRIDSQNFELHYKRKPGNQEPKQILLYWNGVAQPDMISPDDNQLTINLKGVENK